MTVPEAGRPDGPAPPGAGSGMPSLPIRLLAATESALLVALGLDVLGGLALYRSVDPGAATDLVGAFVLLAALALVLVLPALMVRPGRRLFLAVILGIAGSGLLAAGGHDLLDLGEGRRWSMDPAVSRTRVSASCAGQLALAGGLLLGSARGMTRLAGPGAGAGAGAVAAAILCAAGLSAIHLHDVHRRHGWDWHLDDPEQIYLDWHRTAGPQPASFERAAVATNDPQAAGLAELTAHLESRTAGGDWTPVRPLDPAGGRLVDGVESDEGREGRESLDGDHDSKGLDGDRRPRSKRFDLEGRSPRGLVLGLKFLFWPWENHVRLVGPHVHIRRFRAPRWIGFTLRLTAMGPDGSRTPLAASWRFRRPRPPADNVQIEPWIQSIPLPLPAGAAGIAPRAWEIEVEPDDPALLAFDEGARLETWMVIEDP